MSNIDTDDAVIIDDGSDDQGALLAAAEAAIDAPVVEDVLDASTVEDQNSDPVDDKQGGEDDGEKAEDSQDAKDTDDADAATEDDKAEPKDGEDKEDDSSQKASDVDADQDKAKSDKDSSEKEDGSKGDEEAQDDPDPLTLTNNDLRGLRGPVRRSVRVMQDYIRQHQPDVEAYQDFRGFLDEQKIQPADVTSTLSMLGMLNKGDYQGFLDTAAPFINQAQAALGHVLPADLQQEVEAGYISAERAQELAQSRVALNRSERTAQITSEENQTRQQKDHEQAMAGVVNSWEDEKRRSDPDYTDEFADVQRRFTQALLAERGQPRNQQEALAMVNTAYDEAKTLFARGAGKPQATRLKPSDIHSSNNVRAEPTDLMSAAMLGLEQAQAS